jgi:hypothetical protein
MPCSHAIPVTSKDTIAVSAKQTTGTMELDAKISDKVIKLTKSE